MKRSLLLGLTLALSAQAYGQMSTINEWQQRAKVYAQEAAFFASAQVSDSRDTLYVDSKERNKLHKVYEIVGDLSDRSRFTLSVPGKTPGSILKISTSPLVTDLSFERDLNNEGILVPYSDCLAENGQPKLCLDQEYILLFKMSAAAHIQMAKANQNLYELAVKNLGSAEERRQLVEKKKQAEAQLGELLKKQDEIKKQAESLSSSISMYTGMALVLGVILFIVVSGALPIGLLSALVPLLVGTIGFSVYQEITSKTSYKQLMSQHENNIYVAQERRNAISMQEKFMSIIAEAASERKDNPSLKLKP